MLLLWQAPEKKRERQKETKTFIGLLPLILSSALVGLKNMRTNFKKDSGKLRYKSPLKA